MLRWLHSSSTWRTNLKSTHLKTSVAMFGAFAVAACNLILGGGYDVTDDPSRLDGASNDGNPANNPDGSVEQRDGACDFVPTTVSEFQRACTGALCVPFGNKRLTGCDAGGSPATGYGCPGPTPAQPPVTNPPVDAGTPIACDDPSVLRGMPPVYAISGDAMIPFAARIGQALSTLPAASAARLFVTQGISCLNVTTMLEEKTLLSVAPTAFYFEDNAGTLDQKTCSMTNLPNQRPDFSISNVFATSCAALPQGLPTNLSDQIGPVLVVEFGVPVTSGQTSISAEAASLVFGIGGDAGVAPWQDPAAVHIRAPQAGVVLTPAPIINVPPTLWKGTVQRNGNALFSALIAANTAGGALADKSIGIIAATDLDPRRNVMKPLAFQDYGQTCGYYADSTASAFDKINVRDGHYPIWSSTHLITRVDGTGSPISPLAKRIINTMVGAEAIPGLDIIRLYADGRVVPNCAMRVKRQADSRDYTSFRPQNSCGCYFELLATGGTSCTSCKSNTDCANAPGGATQCNLFGTPQVGYCELPGG